MSTFYEFATCRLHVCLLCVSIGAVSLSIGCLTTGVPLKKIKMDPLMKDKDSEMPFVG